MTGALAGGVFWPAPALLTAFGKAVWSLPIILLAFAIRTAVRVSAASAAPIFLLAAGAGPNSSMEELAGSIGSTIAYPIFLLGGTTALWLTGAFFVGLFVSLFVRSLVVRGSSPESVYSPRFGAAQHLAAGTSAAFAPAGASGAGAQSEAARPPVSEPRSARLLRAALAAEYAPAYAGAVPANETTPWGLAPGSTRRELIRAFRESVRNSDEPVPFITRITMSPPAITEADAPIHIPINEENASADPQPGQDGFPAGDIFAETDNAHGEASARAAEVKTQEAALCEAYGAPEARQDALQDAARAALTEEAAEAHDAALQNVSGITLTDEEILIALEGAISLSETKAPEALRDGVNEAPGEALSPQYADQNTQDETEDCVHPQYAAGGKPNETNPFRAGAPSMAGAECSPSGSAFRAGAPSLADTTEKRNDLRAHLRTDSPYVPEREYKKPDAALLVKSHERIDDDTRAQMQTTAELLEKTFFEFGIDARVTNICRGPVITQYEMSVPPGIRLSKVVALQDNIALNLAAASVRIEAPIPGKSAIGIEVPNRKRSIVTLRDILESPEFQNTKARIPLALGQTVSGSPMVADLASMPHIIIAGTTGSGKSVCVNAIICSILYNMQPSQVRFILVDPKYVEMAPYNGIPHLLIPVINKPRAAILALKWLVCEMEERYQRLQSLGARNIESYNERVAGQDGSIPRTTGRCSRSEVFTAGENARGAGQDGSILDRETGEAHTHMPYLILVIDELADLMLLAAKEIEDSISRLAAMSRAVGIHLIFATQRPSVDVLTGVIKNNFPARIAFQVASNIDSRTILDAKGADKLLGKGDSLFVGPGSPAARRVQGAFLSEGEVEKTAAYLRSLGAPLYRMEIFDEDDNDDADAASDADEYGGEDDPLYDEAIQIVITTQRASASYLQRRLKIGYNRAARLVERMEKEGVVGPQLGAKPREILVSSWP